MFNPAFLGKANETTYFSPQLEGIALKAFVVDKLFTAAIVVRFALAAGVAPAGTPVCALAMAPLYVALVALSWVDRGRERAGGAALPLGSPRRVASLVALVALLLLLFWVDLGNYRCTSTCLGDLDALGYPTVCHKERGCSRVAASNASWDAGGPNRAVGLLPIRSNATPAALLGASERYLREVQLRLGKVVLEKSADGRERVLSTHIRTSWWGFRDDIFVRARCVGGEAVLEATMENRIRGADGGGLNEARLQALWKHTLPLAAQLESAPEGSCGRR